MTEQAECASGQFDAAALAALLTEYFEIPTEGAQPTDTLASFGLDSMAMMEMAVVLEERTGTELERLADLSQESTLAEVAVAVRAGIAA